MFKQRPLLLLSLAALLCLAPLAATEPQKAQKAQQEAEANTALSGTKGLVAVRDESGNLRAPTPAEARALRRASTNSAQSPQQRIASVGPNGTRRVVAAPAVLKSLAVKRLPDGSLVFGHISSDEELDNLAAAPAKGDIQ